MEITVTLLRSLALYTEDELSRILDLYGDGIIPPTETDLLKLHDYHLDPIRLSRLLPDEGAVSQRSFAHACSLMAGYDTDPPVSTLAALVAARCSVPASVTDRQLADARRAVIDVAPTLTATLGQWLAVKSRIETASPHSLWCRGAAVFAALSMAWASAPWPVDVPESLRIALEQQFAVLALQLSLATAPTRAPAEFSRPGEGEPT